MYRSDKFSERRLIFLVVSARLFIAGPTVLAVVGKAQSFQVGPVNRLVGVTQLIQTR